MSSLHETSWVPGLAVLAGSLLLAMMYLLFAKKGQAAPDFRLSLEDLDERYRALLGQLKEHATSKHLLTAEGWAAEQQRLEQAAASVLKQRASLQDPQQQALATAALVRDDWQRKLREHAALKHTMPENVWAAMQQALQMGLEASAAQLGQAKHEALKSEARAEKKQQAQAASGSPMLKAGLAVAAVVLFFSGLGLLLAHESKPRDAGREMTGVDPNARAGAPGVPMREDPRLAMLRAKAEQSPYDVDALADVAGEYVKHQQFDQAYPLVMQASGLDPFHVKTRIYRTVLDAVGGGPEALALIELQHLADTYPGAYEARLYAGSLALELKQNDVAIGQFERYLVEAPESEQPPMIRRSIEMLKSQLLTANQAPKAP